MFFVFKDLYYRLLISCVVYKSQCGRCNSSIMVRLIGTSKSGPENTSVLTLRKVSR